MKMKPIKMDLLRCEIIPVIDVVQADAWSRNLEIELTSGRKPYRVPDNTAIIIRYKKADNTGGEYDTLPDGTPAWTVRKNRLTITLAEQALTFPGTVDLSVSFITGGTQLSTFPLRLTVWPLACAATEDSCNYFNITGFLVAPGNAAAGQLLQIASVNSQGYVTGLNAIDPADAGIGATDPDQIRQIVEACLKENPPEQGKPGENGISVTHSWSGTTLTLTSASGTTSTNLQGLKGDKGDTGAQGPQGSTGPAGADGVTPEFSIGTVETLSAGAEATAAITGTPEKPILHFGIPAGAPGKDGEGAASADMIPQYWQTALDEGAEAINTAILNAGYNKSAFLFYSDAHWNYGSQMSPTLLKYLYRHTGMVRTFFGGDIVNNEAEDYDTMKYLWEWRKQIKDLPNHHSVVGNHDDGNTTNNLFSEQYVYGYLLATEETPDITRDSSGIYYYVDSPGEKTRYLCLDTAYQGVGSGQQAFVKKALLTTPEDWHIVAVAHIWHDTDYTVNPPVPGNLNSGASILLSMFDSYNSRSGEYADCGGWVEFCIGGHTHWDHDSTTTTGIPIILVETDSQHVRSGLGFTAGTVTEASVNGIIADYNNHIVHVIRIGRGESRDIEVTSNLASYTNQISTALDTDGVTVYNGTGYKKDIRFSGSSGAFRDNSGSFCTGYIPISSYTAPFTVFFKGITANSSDNYGCNFYFLDGLGVACTDSSDYSNMAEYHYSPMFDDNGNITQITVLENYKYMVFSCSYMDESSVITVNEPLN